MDRLEFFETLGRRQHHVPVIVMPGNDDKLTRPRALHAGAAAFLDKPLNVEQLINFLEAVRG